MRVLISKTLYSELKALEVDTWDGTDSDRGDLVKALKTATKNADGSRIVELTDRAAHYLCSDAYSNAISVWEDSMSPQDKEGNKIRRQAMRDIRKVCQSGKAQVSGYASVEGPGLASIGAALKFQPAFRHRQTGKITVSPGYHDPELLPEGRVWELDDENTPWLDLYEDGFVDAQGNFYTRRHAAQMVRLQYPEALKRGGLMSEDLTMLEGLGRISQIEYGRALPKRIPGRLDFDYSHLLTSPKRGVKLIVRETPGESLAAILFKGQEEFGKARGTVDAGSIFIEEAEIVEGFRGKGYGKALYESLMAHAYHRYGVRTVRGGNHSTAAHYIHRSLAQKHQMPYVGRPNYGGDVPAAHWETKREWEQALTTGSRDERYAPYSYPLSGQTRHAPADSLTNVKVEVVFDGTRFSSIEAFKYAGTRRLLMGSLTVTWTDNRAIVTDVRVRTEIARKGLATRMYEAAAKLAETRRLPLSSDVSRYPGADAFWKKQVAAGRAQAIKVGPNAFQLDPERVRHYQLTYPPPRDLSGTRKCVRKCKK